MQIKQFERLSARGITTGPFNISEADVQYIGSLDALDNLLVDSSVRDLGGNIWIRLPDAESSDGCRPAPCAPDEPGPAATLQAERLERIATAALQGLITGVTSSPELGAVHSQGARDRGFTFEQYLAMDAVGMAKALIAELDRQP